MNDPSDDYPLRRAALDELASIDQELSLTQPVRTGYRANYSYTVEDGVVCIIDLDNGKSVTNDAEAVIADLIRDGVPVEGTPVIYRDTDGIWDQLVTSEGRFSAFKSINERDKEAAKARVK